MQFSITIHGGKQTLVDIKNFELDSNHITILLGESGIGKTLISKALFGLLDPELLEASLNGKSYEEWLNGNIVSRLKRDGFFVFQEPSTHLNPLDPLSTQLNEGRLQRNPQKDEKTILTRLWKDADPQFLDKLLEVYPRPHRPSGGEKQRVLLVMAFKKIYQYLRHKEDTRGALFIFDEPSGNLDNVYRNRFLKLLTDCYRRKPFTALLITHDYSMISEMHESHPDLEEIVTYKELRRENGAVKLFDFSAGDYLQWLDRQEHKPQSAAHEKQELLRMAGGIEVFGRRLTFHKEKPDSEPTDFVIHRGEMVYLKAPSGMGKTTVAKLALGLLNARKLALAYGPLTASEKSAEDFWRRHIWGKRATMVFQHADEALNQKASVLDTFRALSGNGRVDKGKVLRRLQDLFDNNLPADFLERRIGRLSGGQKQRVNILRGLVLDTDVLILDEPLNGLDLRSADKVINKIRQRQKEGKGIWLISHNEEIFDRIVPPEQVYYLRSTPVS